MKRIIIASHGKLAKGMQDTLNLFTGDGDELDIITAYEEGNESVETQIDRVFSKINEQDEALIFTDLFGGSVNQKIILKAINKKNVYIIAGFNLPIILEAITTNQPLTDETVNQLVEKGKLNLQLVNTSQIKDINDDFFD